MLNRVSQIATKLASAPEEHIFGVGSFVGEISSRDSSMVSDITSISSEPSYEISLLLILILYILWVGRSLSNMEMSEFRVSNPFGELSDTRGLGGTVRVGDVILEWGLVVAMVALLVTRLVDISQHLTPIGVDLAQRIISLGIGRWLALICVVFMLSMVWGVLLLRFMGYILRCDWIGSEIMRIKSRLLLMSVIWLLPIVLMSTLEMTGFFMTYFAVIVSVTFIAIYLFRTFLLFRSQKISILHWFLYLCSVEIIPITLMWVCFAKN